MKLPIMDGPKGKFYYWDSQMAGEAVLGVFVVNRVQKEYPNVFSQKGKSCPTRPRRLRAGGDRPFLLAWIYPKLHSLACLHNEMQARRTVLFCSWHLKYTQTFHSGAFLRNYWCTSGARFTQNARWFQDHPNKQEGQLYKLQRSTFS